MRTHWATRKRDGTQHVIGQLDDALIAQAPVEGGRAGLGLLPLIPGNDYYPEQPGAGGDYVPAGSGMIDILAVAQEQQSSLMGRGVDSIYYHFEGDLFTPGAENYVFESRFERTALQTIWGNAFLRTPNTFSPVQPPQVFSPPHVVTSGIGGVVAGQMALQPLEFESE